MNAPQTYWVDLPNEKVESIRASRLSNREVMLSSTAVLHNMNLPSSSSSASVDYLIRNRTPCATFRRSQSITDQSNELLKAKLAMACASSNRTVKSSTDDDDTETDTDTASASSNTENNDQDNNDTDLSLSQYELDIVNKYLNEMTSSNDECNEHDQSNSENRNVQSMELSPSSVHDGGGGGDDDSSGNIGDCTTKDAQADQCTHSIGSVDQANTADVSIESDSESPTQSQSHDASTPPMQQLCPVSSANDEIRACTQPSRQIVFDQINQIDAMINPIRYTDYLGHTHNDVNNNNLSLSSHTTNHTNNNNHTDSQSANQGRHYSSERRHYGMAGRTNPISNRLTITNLPIIVGITSCVWGLFFYAVKCFFYSDLT